MLYRPEDFEPVTEEPWDRDRALSAIERIVADADEAYRRQPLWPPASGLPRRLRRPRALVVRASPASAPVFGSDCLDAECRYPLFG